MKKVINFQDVQRERTAYSEKLKLIAFCQEQLGVAMAAMHERGADTSQIIRILRHAITQLELDQPS